MAIQPFAPSVCFAVLEAHHLKGMRPEMKRALLLLAGGMPRDVIAGQLSGSVATIKRWIDTATAEIMVCVGDEHKNHGELRGFWVRSHLECCLGDQTGAAA
jgi:hypothetical protein